MTASFEQHFSEQSLNTKQILVTGIRDQSLYSFVKKLSDSGADVESIPLIEVRFLPINADDVQAFAPDWIFFTSKNAVHAFYQPVETRSQNFLSSSKIAVVGPSTAEALRSYGKKADFTSPKANAQEAVQTFLEDLSKHPNEKQKPLILWPCGNRAYPDLALGLLSAGCNVYPLVAYETLDATLSETQKEKLQTQTWDIIVFGSASAVQAYTALSLQENPKTVYACLGSKTRLAVTDAGLKGLCVQGRDSHYDSLLEAILTFI